MAFSIILVLGYWLIYPYNPVDLYSIKIDSPVVASSVLKYKISYCKYTDLPSTSVRQLVDGIIIFFPEIVTNNPEGCSESERFLELPTYIPSSKYHLRISVSYKVNPLRSITKTITSNEFQLIK